MSQPLGRSLHHGGKSTTEKKMNNTQVTGVNPIRSIYTLALVPVPNPAIPGKILTCRSVMCPILSYQPLIPLRCFRSLKQLETPHLPHKHSTSPEESPHPPPLHIHSGVCANQHFQTYPLTKPSHVGTTSTNPPTQTIYPESNDV